MLTWKIVSLNTAVAFLVSDLNPQMSRDLIAYPLLKLRRLCKGLVCKVRFLHNIFLSSLLTILDFSCTEESLRDFTRRFRRGVEGALCLSLFGA